MLSVCLQHIVVLITDGVSNVKAHLTVPQAERMHSIGIEVRERSLFMAGGGGGGWSAKSIGEKKSPPPMTLLENFCPPAPSFKNMPLCCSCAPITVIIHVMSLSRKKVCKIMR